jgi:hypothetical protein
MQNNLAQNDVRLPVNPLVMTSRALASEALPPDNCDLQGYQLLSGVLFDAVGHALVERLRAK